MVGGALGWLWASREAAGARQTVENLRLQLDEVVKERDVEPRRRDQACRAGGGAGRTRQAASRRRSRN